MPKASTGAATVATGLLFPECPRLHEGAIWFTDASRVCSVIPGQAVQVQGEIPARLVLGLDFFADGSAVTNAVLERIVYAVRPDGDVEPLVDLGAYAASPLNELRVTADGGLLVGPMGFNPLAGEAPAASPLLRVRPDRSVEPSGPGLVFSNGMCLVDRGRRIVISEAAASRIVAIAIQPDGTLANDLEVVADLSPWGGNSDGICVLADGSLFYADPVTGEVVRVDDGKVVRRIDTGYAHATSCVADEEAGMLYITATNAMPSPSLQWDGLGALVAFPLN